MRPPSLSEIYGMLGSETHQFCPIRTPSSGEPFVALYWRMATMFRQYEVDLYFTFFFIEFL